MSSPDEQKSVCTIAVVGDVHDLWDRDDEVALKFLGVDLVLLVGDFGNESVEVVRAIADLSLPKAATFGNHDAWYTATEWGRKKCPYDRQVEDWVQQQIDLLGASHVGYGKLDLPEFGLSVVGGRPFSWGGSSWKNTEAFYREWFGVTSFEESTAKIVEAVRDAAYDTIIFMGHCGPTGLGSNPDDPCGRDWQPLGGDYGDPDLEAAIAQAQTMGKAIPLVAFGHMHHNLRHTKEHPRRRLQVGSNRTVYLNAASVPRIVEKHGDRFRNFSIVTLEEGQVTEAALIWLNGEFEVHSREVLYKQAPSMVELASS